MTPEQAIETLNQQIEKLSDQDIQTDVWVSTTTGIATDYFGPDSAEVNFIKQFRFDANFGWSASDQDQIRSKAKAKQFIKDCIRTIERKGLYKEPNSNFLSRVDNATVLGSLTFILAASFLGGVQWGERNSSVQNIELNRQVKEQQATIDKLQQQLNAKQVKLLPRS